MNYEVTIEDGTIKRVGYCEACGGQFYGGKRGRIAKLCLPCRGWAHTPNRLLVFNVLEKAGWKCQKCGTSNKKLHLHHIDGNGSHKTKFPNNSPENLRVLCPSCHSEIHGCKNVDLLNKAFKMRRHGMTYQKIGEHFGLSRQRIHALLKNKPI